MDEYSFIKCGICGICWSDHPPDAPCVRYRPVPVEEGGPVELPVGPEVVRAVEANRRPTLEPSPNGKDGH